MRCIPTTLICCVALCVVSGLFGGCESKTPKAPNGNAAATPGPAANNAAIAIWDLLISPDPADHIQAWHDLAQADAALLRGARYSSSGPKLEVLHIDNFSFTINPKLYRAWEDAFKEAFDETSKDDAVRACIALDQLGAGIMLSGTTLNKQSRQKLNGLRAVAYDQGLFARFYARRWADSIDPDGPRDSFMTKERITEIATTNEIFVDIH